MTAQTLKIDHDANGIVWCLFNRPEVRNALNLQMVRELHTFLEEVAHNEQARVVVFSGVDTRAFIGGADIAELVRRGANDAFAQINSGLFRAIECLPIPTIAAISGFALGGGCEFALACDIRICSEHAQFGQPEVSLGIMPGAGATYRLARIVGSGWARELILTGKMVDAQKALELGLVTHVVASDELRTKAQAIAQEITKNGAHAVRAAKLSMRMHDELSTPSYMTLEATSQATLFEDDEKRQRMTAFLEKRKSTEKK